MSLIPTRWVDFVMPGDADADAFSEGIGGIYLQIGYHDSPDGPIVLYQKRTVRNQFDTVVREDIEVTHYETPTSPPVRYERTTKARPWLPKINEGRGLIPVEQEIIDYHPWAMYFGFHRESGTLSRNRVVKGWAVYRRHATDEELSVDEKARLEASGLNSDGPAGYLVDSAVTWEEMLGPNKVVTDPGVRQVARYMDPLETWRTYEVDQPDMTLRGTYHKVHIRPGPPDFQLDTEKKEGWNYTLGVPILPPKLTAAVTGSSVRLEAKGGGATLPGNDILPPDRYRFLRRTVSTPGKAADADPHRFWVTPPGADPKRKLLGVTAVTLIDGTTPADSVPTPTAYTEPGDTSAPDVERWVLVAEKDNEAATRRDPGQAVVFDSDLTSGAVYEYVAVAVIGSEESAPIESVKYNISITSQKNVAYNETGDLRKFSYEKPKIALSYNKKHEPAVKKIEEALYKLIPKENFDVSYTINDPTAAFNFCVNTLKQELQANNLQEAEINFTKSHCFEWDGKTVGFKK